MNIKQNKMKLTDVSQFFKKLDVKTLDEKGIIELILIKTIIDKILQSMRQS